jgi:rfaE bifunctional protein kinase chain/domain
MPVPGNFTEIFDAFKDKRVLVVGDVMVDAYIWGKVERISPEAPVPVVAVKKRENRLGGAANVALNVKALGATPVICTIIGQDVKGTEFLELLDREKLSPSGIIRSSERITTTKFRVIGNQTQLLRVDEETDSPLSAPDQEHLMTRIENLLEKECPDVIIFQDYDKGVLSPGLIERVVELAGKRKIPVAADPKKRNFHAYSRVSLFKPNFKELREGTGFDGDVTRKEELLNKVIAFRNKQSIGIILVTLSEDGVLICWNDGGEEKTALLPAHLRSVHDVSGAGDTVISVAALCLCLGLPPDVLAFVANVAGGLVCEEVGVVPVNRERLLREVIRLRG